MSALASPAVTPAIAAPSRAIGLETISIRKIFGPLIALDDVSIKVPAGSFHALLGENGAGKSTLVKCIMGFYQPDGGQVLVNGHEIAMRNPREARAARHRHGLPALHAGPSLTGAENLVITRARRSRRDRLDRGEEAACRVPRPHAVPRAARRAGRASGGRRKAEARDPEAALPRPAVSHPGRADLGAHARRGGRDAWPRCAR